MRSIVLTAGLLGLAFLWLGPLPDLARNSFSAHMALHMGVVAIVAPLFAIGVAGGQFDLVRRAPSLLSPIPASLVELAVVWGWHAPALHELARHTLAGIIAEQSMFLAAGTAIWMAVLGGGPFRTLARSAAGIVGLLLTSMHMTLLGALLALTPRPLYEHSAASISASSDELFVSQALCGPPRAIVEQITGLSALADQHLGGAIMLAVGGVSYLLGGLWLTASLIRDDAADAGERS